MQLQKQNPILGLIDDFEEFISKMEVRKKQLEELKDQFLIYDDKNFMKSIKAAEMQLRQGKGKLLRNDKEMFAYFESL